MKKIILAISIAIALVGQASAETLETLTGFYYTSGSSQKSYIAQGGGQITEQDGWIFARPKKSLYDDEVFVIEISHKDDKALYWSIYFKNPKGGPLEKGLFSGSRYPFQKPGQAGFYWIGCGRGLNTSFTHLQILEVEYSPDQKTITRLAMDFVQFEETWDNTVLDPKKDPCALGSFRYNSTIPFSTKPIISE